MTTISRLIAFKKTVLGQCPCPKSNNFMIMFIKRLDLNEVVHEDNKLFENGIRAL